MARLAEGICDQLLTFATNQSATSLEKDTVYASWALEFVVIAREFCERVEKFGQPAEGEVATEGTDRAYAEWLYSVLPLIFYKLTRFPKFADMADAVEPPVVLSEMEYESLRLQTATALGDFERMDLPLSIEQTERFGPQPSLGEVVADVYQELLTLLVNYQDGVEERMRDALVGLRLGFGRRWGEEMLLALRWLHLELSASELLDDYGLLDD